MAVALRETEPISLDENQKTAIKTAIENGVTVITGGPGTGKLPLSRPLLKYFQEHGVGVLLCAPTGRAAKRISETSGYEAKNRSSSPLKWGRDRAGGQSLFLQE